MGYEQVHWYSHMDPNDQGSEGGMGVANSRPGMPCDGLEGIVHISVRLRGLSPSFFSVIAAHQPGQLNSDIPRPLMVTGHGPYTLREKLHRTTPSFMASWQSFAAHIAQQLHRW